MLTQETLIKFSVEEKQKTHVGRRFERKREWLILLQEMDCGEVGEMGVKIIPVHLILKRNSRGGVDG